MNLKNAATRLINLKISNKISVPLAQRLSAYSFCQVQNNLHSQKQSFQKQNVQVARFQELLNLNTEQSLTQAAKMLATLQNISEQQEIELKQLNERMSFFPQNLTVLLQKQKKLVENISLQQQDDQMIGKRLQKQLDDCKKFGVSKIAKQILEVSDALRNSLKLAKKLYQDQPNHEQIQKIKTADEIVKKFLNNYGIEQFDPIAMPYDPNTQQSMYQVPCPQGYQKNTVAQTLRTGFKINGRLLRSAKVGIFTKGSQP